MPKGVQELLKILLCTFIFVGNTTDDKKQLERLAIEHVEKMESSEEGIYMYCLKKINIKCVIIHLNYYKKG